LARQEPKRSLIPSSNQFEIMSRNHDGRTLRISLLEEIHDFFRQFRIQVTRRFVRDNQARSMNESTGNRNSLLLAT
jgi:hypothetical protein